MVTQQNMVAILPTPLIKRSIIHKQLVKPNFHNLYGLSPHLASP